MERLPLRGGEVFYAPRIELGDDPAKLMRALIDEIDWQSRDIVMWGRSVKQPRLTAWYGDRGCSYTYSGTRFDPSPWTVTLRALKAAVERASGATFNSVLLNYYRDHRDGMGYHSDDERELGPRPTIASLSLGETRRFVMKHRHDTSMGRVALELGSGSLLVMKGETQRHWKHALPKRTKPCGPRVNLTFRRIVE